MLGVSVNALGRAANGLGGVNASRNAGPGRRYPIETDTRLVNYDNFISSDQWLADLGCEATGIDQWLYLAKRRRKLYPTLRVGREALARSCPWSRSGSGCSDCENFRNTSSTRWLPLHEKRGDASTLILLYGANVRWRHIAYWKA
ncbi:hypothetical protein HEP75_04266 [Xanthomonas sp. SI]|nr:hypothetical protein HEP75_04266 [Xanthomonas sp. SI]